MLLTSLLIGTWVAWFTLLGRVYVHAKKCNATYPVFHVHTGDGNDHQVAGTQFVEWVALRTLDGTALPTQAEMRFMLRHMDDAAADKALYELIHAALPRMVRARNRGAQAISLVDDAS